MDRIIYNQQGSYLYPLLTPTGTYQPASSYPNAPGYSYLSSTLATAAEKSRQSAAAATYNAYAAQAAAARAQAAAIQAAHNEAAVAAAARLAMMQPKATPASKGNPWNFVGGAYRMGAAATAPVVAPVYRPVPAPAPVVVPAYRPAHIPVPVYRPAPAPVPAPAPAPSGSQWTYNPAGYYVRR
ncbi:hypothetical protein BZA77DRAFT_120658 [Pyronema omphalodes]|nr:hypothetical protein BZA77DRAFT_120658 [Pyronema omphalodes]